VNGAALGLFRQAHAGFFCGILDVLDGGAHLVDNGRLPL
jgi:hypothetical protein